MGIEILKSAGTSLAAANLDANKRYRYFLREVAESVEVWTLKHEDGNFVSFDDDAASYYYVLWPCARFAEMCARDDWEDSEPVDIDVCDFIEKWIPGLKRDKIGVVIFPTLENPGLVIESSELEKLEQDLLMKLDEANDE